MIQELSFPGRVRALHMAGCVTSLRLTCRRQEKSGRAARSVLTHESSSDGRGGLLTCILPHPTARPAGKAGVSGRAAVALDLLRARALAAFNPASRGGAVSFPPAPAPLVGQGLHQRKRCLLCIHFLRGIECIEVQADGVDCIETSNRELRGAASVVSR